jgi:hypothetical protein
MRRERGFAEGPEGLSRGGRHSVCFIIKPALEKDKRKNSGEAAIFPLKTPRILSFLTRD